MALILLFAVHSPTFAHPDLLSQINELDAQLTAEPGNAKLLAERGDLYRLHQDYQAAAEDFDAARNSDTAFPMLDFYESRLLLDIGDADGADRLLSNYLDAHPQHGAAWVLRGETRIRLMQLESAAEYFSRAIQASTRPSPGLYRLKVLSLVAIGEPGAAKALQAVDAGLHRFPLEVTLLGLGTDLALAWNQQAKAENYLDRLPEPLRALPRWSARIEAANCLAVAEPPIQEQCLQQARDGIARQVEEFMGPRMEQ